MRARAAREKGGLEQAARRERYAFLRRVQDDEGAAAIAVAHTRDDQAETLLLRLLRGAGATGLAGMRPRAATCCARCSRSRGAEVLAHLRERGLAWREDPSNADPAHLRNRVRHELLPYLEERFNPRDPRGARADRRAARRRGRATSGREAEALARADREPGRRARSSCDRAALAGAPAAVARAALRLALARTGGLAGVDRGHVERRAPARPRGGARPAAACRFPAAGKPASRTTQLRLEKRAIGRHESRIIVPDRAMRDKISVLFTEEQIARRVAELGEEITPGLRRAGDLRPRPDEGQPGLHGRPDPQASRST